MNFGFRSDLRAFLRRALQFGQAELVSVETPLGQGTFEAPTDVVVSAKSKAPQLAVELQWHPRGEDHLAFADAAMRDVVRMAIASATKAVEQGSVLLAAPGRFWRWLAGYAGERAGYELLDPDPETPVSAKTDFLGGSAWRFLFEGWSDPKVPERLWSSLAAEASVRSPWGDVELRLLNVKGIGSIRPLRDGKS